LRETTELATSVENLLQILEGGVGYTPQDMIQVMNKDGSVKQSIVMNDDGTGTVTEGGVHGVPPPECLLFPALCLTLAAPPLLRLSLG
jgi:hypothetical protein